MHLLEKRKNNTTSYYIADPTLGQKWLVATVPRELEESFGATRDLKQACCDEIATKYMRQIRGPCKCNKEYKTGYHSAVLCRTLRISGPSRCYDEISDVAIVKTHYTHYRQCDYWTVIYGGPVLEKTVKRKAKVVKKVRDGAIAYWRRRSRCDYVRVLGRALERQLGVLAAETVAQYL
jgi:hypothetical protein